MNGQKKQRYFYSGKKKIHTVKSQVIVDKKKPEDDLHSIY
jgi:hypothetical protein